MDKKELCERYISVVLGLKKKEEALNTALNDINSDNTIFGIVPDDMSLLLDNLVLEQLGAVVYDWLTWWIWETDQKDGIVYMNNEEIKIESFYDLWENLLKDESD